MGLNILAPILLVVAFITFAISAGFITDSSRRITTIPEYESNNSDLNTAHKYSTIAAIAAWISISLMVIAAILLFVFASEVLIGFSSYFIYGFLGLSLLGTFIVGILSILTAVYINKAKVENNEGAYKSAIIAAVLATVVFVLVITVLLIKVFYKPKKKEEPVDKEIISLKDELADIK
jgi:cell division protein FtsX